MKKFAFRLATPLKLKLQEEDRQKIVVAACQEEYQQNLVRLEELKQSLAELQVKLREASELKGSLDQTRPLDLNQLAIMQGYIPVLLNKIDCQQEQVALALTRLEEVRQRLIQIMKDRKILDKLQEKALIQYHLELNREEQKNLDELAAVSYLRNR